MDITRTPAELKTIGIRHLPMLVLTDNLYSWVARRVRHHTHGEYSHAMWMHRPGFVASQGLLYKELPIDRYLEGKHRVKLWCNPAWKAEARVRLFWAIEGRLAAPFRNRLYDGLGILGQRIKRPWLNFPRLRYCSESAAEILQEAEDYPKNHPSPADINRWCKTQPQMQVFGVYDPDCNSGNDTRITSTFFTSDRFCQRFA